MFLDPKYFGWPQNSSTLNFVDSESFWNYEYWTQIFAPSWTLSKAENLASTSLQDGANYTICTTILMGAKWCHVCIKGLSGECLENVWRVSWEYLQGVKEISDRCVEGMLGHIQTGSVRSSQFRTCYIKSGPVGQEQVRLGKIILGHIRRKDFQTQTFATLGYILDYQLIWESGKFQLARWSHNVALFSTQNHPSTHPPPAGHLLSDFYITEEAEI